MMGVEAPKQGFSGPQHPGGSVRVEMMINALRGCPAGAGRCHVVSPSVVQIKEVLHGEPLLGVWVDGPKGGLRLRRTRYARVVKGGLTKQLSSPTPLL